MSWRSRAVNYSTRLYRLHIASTLRKVQATAGDARNLSLSNRVRWGARSVANMYVLVVLASVELRPPSIGLANFFQATPSAFNCKRRQGRVHKSSEVL